MSIENKITYINPQLMFSFENIEKIRFKKNEPSWISIQI
ncbi:MAG: hypothetical protein ACD_19C00426G0083 [uncultured bacterium]|nr:MAG: hypothetical protein ACD_19C00426G0083 [uncultured bacterium]